MKTTFQVLATCLAFGSAGNQALGQAIETIPSLSSEIVKAVQTAPLRSIISITGTREFSENVLKADEIVFEECDSRIVFTDIRVPHVVVATPKLKFKDTSCNYTIARSFSISGAIGSTGGVGGNGSPSFVHNQGSGGRHGGHGSDGLQGGIGETLHHPPVYFIVGDIEAQTGSPLNVSMSLIFHGLHGGPGGVGGIGGNGGNGEKGGDGADGLFDCRRGPGRGGNAGNGGKYGLGGPAGSGGNGADIYLVAPKSILNTITYFQFGNRGGQPGTPGQCGTSGRPGMTGDQGRLTNRCRSGGGPGSRGQSPAVPPICEGPRGVAGSFGKIYSYSTDVSTLLTK